MTIPNEKFPFIGRILKLVQVKSNQIIEEVAFDLSPEHIELGAQYIQCMAVASSGPRRGR